MLDYLATLAEDQIWSRTMESGKICQHQLTQQTVVSQSIGSFYPKLSLRGRMPLALLEKRQVDPFPMPEKQTHTEATMTVASLQGVNQT